MFDVNELGRVRDVLFASIAGVVDMVSPTEYCAGSQCEHGCTGTCYGACHNACEDRCTGAL